MPESLKVTVLQVDSFKHTNKHELASCCLLLVKLKSLHYRYAICCQYEFVCIKNEYNNKMLDNQKKWAGDPPDILVFLY